MSVTIIGAIVTAIVTAVLSWLSKRQQDAQNAQNATAVALQHGMLVSAATAQGVQANMDAGAAAVPPITDIASAQAAFGQLPANPVMPTRAIVFAPNRSREMLQFTRGFPMGPSFQKLSGNPIKTTIVLFCLLFLVGCSSSQPGTGATAVGQFPVINNPAPPAAMFANPEAPLTPREQASLTWSASLYRRVQVYNDFATKSNAENGYYAPVSAAPVTAPQARRMFE